MYDREPGDLGWMLLIEVARALGDVLVGFVFAASALVSVLALSRTLRPEGPWRCWPSRGEGGRAWCAGEPSRAGCCSRASWPCWCDGSVSPVWLLPPTLPLASAPDRPWVVHRPRRGLGWRLGYRAHELTKPTGTSLPRMKLEEVDGAVVLGPGLLPEDVAVWQRPIPLEELDRHIPASAHVLLELPRSKVWTVQDAISICATFPWVQCALSAP